MYMEAIRVLALRGLKVMERKMVRVAILKARLATLLSSTFLQVNFLLRNCTY